MEISVEVANQGHYKYAETICLLMEEAAKVRGTGIAKRKPEYVQHKMEEGKAVIALDGDKVVGFCYIENWEDQKYVANSGLIIHPDYRNHGLAKRIKKATFDLSMKKFPNAKLFGITTSLAVMKINSDLGYKPVTFSELTHDEEFWKGCQSCKNYDILQRTERKTCLCTGMVCDLKEAAEKQEKGEKSESKKKSWEHFRQFVKNRFQQKSKQFPKIFKVHHHEE